MTKHQFLCDVHTVLRNLASVEPSAEQRQHFEQLRKAAWEMLRNTREYSATVFAMYEGGVWIGPTDSPRYFLDPGLAGLLDANAILFTWVTTHRAKHSSELIGGPSGNALNGRLTRAAEWLENVANSRDLGSAVRKIAVSRDGTITPPSIQLDWIKFERS